MSGDRICPSGEICTWFCIEGCNRVPRVVTVYGPPAAVLDLTFGRQSDALQAENQCLLEERAELRGDVAALWQRLGDVISLFSGQEMMSADGQDKLRRARALHALWSEVPDTNNGG